MKAATVLDASAVLAFLQGEPGADVVLQALESGSCVVSAANHAEIISKSLDHGLTLSTLQGLFDELDYSVVDITVADGVAAGAMRAKTRHLGLSLGDRLCLALGQRLGAKVLTADRPWLKVAKALGVSIQCIRPE
jgi:ribonuclease VapC